MLRRTATVVTLALTLVACGGDPDVSTSPTPTPAASPATPSPTPASPSPSAPGPSPSPTDSSRECDDEEVLSTVAAALATARLEPATSWSPAAEDGPFVARTVTGQEYADGLGFDCGLRVGAATDRGVRLLVAAWTGPRMAFVVQTTEEPGTAYDRVATVDLLVDAPDGEFLDDARTLWAGTTTSGETFVVGHVDFNLGAAAKDWFAGGGPPPDDDGDDEPLLASERYGIAVLEAAGMREVDIAEPAEIGSEEGHLQFVSPSGQISVADVAPTGWFDPTAPRYYDGPTRFEVVDGSRVRVTEPGADAPEWAIAAELGFACADFVWLLQPPGNGTTEEMLATATAILATDAC